MTLNDSVTFPQPFSQVRHVMLAAIGAKTGVITALTDTINTTPIPIIQVGVITNNGFDVRMTRTSNMGSNAYWAYSWIAIGVV